MIDLGPYYTSLRYAITAGGGIAVGLGFASGAVDAQSLLSGLNDIADGTKLIMKGAGTIAVVAAPIYGIIKSTLASKVAAVKTAAPAELAVAMTKVAPAEMVVAVKNMPEVAGVVTTDAPDGVALARSIPSAAVASAGTADAVAIAKPTGA